ncbi:hypothetical protein LEP1GSC047_2311 [Leptospira inadai serovar Lyme str. 10]|uniref:Uncharacterized protein n=1 Tax=Leptospira inadai serovar Lyme str. 10 TaxID=1049790 RepID=V6HFJ6_9LEPT|nr:hypothetical protein LEP1GSC047_2311 [Leptospira inadai serovar Lyme str. 10]
MERCIYYKSILAPGLLTPSQKELKYIESISNERTDDLGANTNKFTKSDRRKQIYRLKRNRIRKYFSRCQHAGRAF